MSSSVANEQNLGFLAQAERIAEDFVLSPDDVRRVTGHFVRQMRDGLTNHRAWQLPSFVRSVPTGVEKGTFLAVDLGGSNCRICLVQLHGDSTFTVTQSRHRVPAEVMVCQSYKPLFNFIADKISQFLKENSALDTKSHSRHVAPYSLGFTFSFTCEQTSLAGGNLIHWDKGWDIPEALGKDPCVMLQESIDALELPVLVTVLANDSVGTLLTRSYTAGLNTSTLAAVIFGTGTNAAYVEKITNIKRLGAVTGQDGNFMVINTEWGCLDDKMEVLPRTPFDDELDKSSNDQGSQMLEKRVSGLYLGELLRLALVKLVQETNAEMVLHKDSPLFQRQGIDSSFLSELAITSSKEPSQLAALIRDRLSVSNVKDTDVQAIQSISTAIVKRAARLAGAALAAIIIQSERLQLSPAKAKYPDADITEYQPTSQPAIPPITGTKRFKWRLKLLWRRIFKFFTGAESSKDRPPTGSIAKHSSTSTESDSFSESVIDIGADGSLIELYPTFEADIRGALREVHEIGLVGEQRVRIGLAKDGSGVGAALMAQAAAAAAAETDSKNV